MELGIVKPPWAQNNLTEANFKPPTKGENGGHLDMLKKKQGMAQDKFLQLRGLLKYLEFKYLWVARKRKNFHVFKCEQRSESGEPRW